MDRRLYDFFQEMSPVQIKEEFIEDFIFMWRKHELLELREYVKQYFISNYGEVVRNPKSLFYATFGAEISFKYSEKVKGIPMEKFIENIMYEMQDDISDWGWGWYTQWNELSPEVANYIYNEELYPKLKDSEALEKYIYPYITLTIPELCKYKSPKTLTKLLNAEKIIIEQVRTKKSRNELIQSLIKQLFNLGYREEAYQVTKRNDFPLKWKYLFAFPNEFEDNKDKLNEIFYLGQYIIDQAEHITDSIFERMQRAVSDYKSLLINERELRKIPECEDFLTKINEANIEIKDDLIFLIKEFIQLVDDLIYRYSIKISEEIVKNSQELFSIIDKYHINRENIEFITLKIDEIKKGLDTKSGDQITSLLSQLDIVINNQHQEAKKIESILKNQETESLKSDEMSQDIAKIKVTVNDIQSDIKKVLIKVENLQDDVSNKLDSTNNIDELEIILHKHSEDILNLVKKEYENRLIQEYEEYEKSLKKKFGDAWVLLEPDSQNYLVTSRITYDDLEKYEKIKDYSPVCISMTKALEKELFERFCKRYTRYIREKKGLELPQYPKGLIFSRNGHIRKINDDKFSLGSIPDVFGFKYNNNTRSFEIDNSSNSFNLLKDYCKNELFNNWFSNDAELESYLIKLIRDIDEIRGNYRNPSAHKNKLQKIHAEKCYDDMIRVEKLLVDFISKLRS